MNILILSCGTRNKIVQYFKKELNGVGLVLATDCSNLAPALYEADHHFIVPRIDDANYLDNIIAICKEYNVKALFSLIDTELSLIAEHKEHFLSIGTFPIVSDSDVTEMCFNKFKMYRFLVDNGFQTIKSYVEKELFYQDIVNGKITYPVFIKPVTGSASINIHRVNSKEEVELLFNYHQNLMIQEYMDGIEFGADVYIDLINGEPISIFTKEKIAMRAGETDKSVSVKDEKLFQLITDFVKVAGFKGMIDIDIFKIDGEYYISEVNPRFGGGYPHAYESGVNFPKLIIDNLKGKVNSNKIGQYDEGIYMMKYNEVLVSRI
ncbi:ATP-grasp domain-containing protein [Lysinibacillus antri]|uniref:ATP-grasp domain-containing protein n=1 Tax=Lysinibacillus antri TaxID=2498145 RepID=A0A3S0R7Q2_9BACI|nr:ATP-grasp domain-containing protein [Lysinibacillus antri]RUL55179.1 ATP-grasp domain-containing protein [Lysinibacillus antri]